MQKFQLFLICC